jgi:hypothetical protein
MKRNKRTVTMGCEDLTPLTEYILAQMGDEGVDIRERLKQLYRHRYCKNPPIFQELVRRETAQAPLNPKAWSSVWVSE